MDIMKEKNNTKQSLPILMLVITIVLSSFFCANAPQVYFPEKLYVYVTRGSNHGVSPRLTESKIKSMFSGYGPQSINPLLLQIGVSFSNTQIIVRNITVPNLAWNGSGNFCDGFRTFRPGFTGISLSDINGINSGETVSSREFISSYKILITSGTGIYIGSESFSGGYACTVPGKTMMITASSTRNVLVHELGHTMGLVHSGAGCNKEKKVEWIMRATIFDESYRFHPCERNVVDSAITNDFGKHRDPLIRNIFKRENINARVYEDALSYIHMAEYRDNNFRIDPVDQSGLTTIP